MKTLKVSTLAMIALSFFSLSSNAQDDETWSTGTDKIYSSPVNDVKVGIGTSSPAARLHVEGSSTLDPLRVKVSGSTKLWVNTNGGLAVGSYTTPPTNGLAVSGLTKTKNIQATGTISLLNSTTTPWSYGFLVDTRNEQTKGIAVQLNGTETFRVYGSGVVNAKKIYAESFQVRPDAMSIAWYDHVFNPDYKLMSLEEVETFVKQNSHLPDIPSEKQVNTEGFDLAEMNGLLLKKVEELTLYMIEQQKRITHLENEVLVLKK